MKCRVCDCTTARGCAVGCGWAAEGLCDVCADLQERIVADIKRAAVPPRLVDILAAFHEHVVDDLYDADDLRTRRAVHDLFALGYLDRNSALRYWLTKAGQWLLREAEGRNPALAVGSQNSAADQGAEAGAQTFTFQCEAVLKAATGRRWRTVAQLVELTGLKAKAVKPALTELLKTKRIEQHIDGVRYRALVPRCGR